MTEKEESAEQRENPKDPPENGSKGELLGAAKKLPPGKRQLKKQESTFFGRNSMMLGDTKVPLYKQLHLSWTRPPSNCLVIKKYHDSAVLKKFKMMCIWLITVRGLDVYVEEKDFEELQTIKAGDLPRSSSYDNFQSISTKNLDTEFVGLIEKIKVWKIGKDMLNDKIDFIACLGGDGTLLYASSLFQRSVPPIIAFSLGSLGFLTPFDFKEFPTILNKVLKGTLGFTLRNRLESTLWNKGTGESDEDNEDHIIVPESIQVLNEVVIHRGIYSGVCMIDIYCDDFFVTTVIGDGVIVATPTGSTAYAAATGASIVAPSVPCSIITPICPHSLSFRPIMVPLNCILKCKLNNDARGDALISFDGRHRQDFTKNHVVEMSASEYPLPCIDKEGSMQDWFNGLQNTLQWNGRSVAQKPLEKK